MRNKIKLVLTLGAIFISSFLFFEQARANTCWDGDCKATCSADEEPSTQPGVECSETYEICCVPKSCTGAKGCVTTSTCETIVSGSCSSGQSCCDKLKTGSDNPCKDLVDGAACTTTDGKAGKCKSGFCNTSTDDDDDDDDDSTSSGKGWNSGDLEQFDLPDAGGDGDVGNVIVGILDWLLTIIGILAIIAFVLSGIQYFLVATDEKILESAKKTMKAAIIGLIVALSGFIAIQAVDSMLRVDSLF
jgi:hypothetical protein